MSGVTALNKELAEQLAKPNAVATQPSVVFICAHRSASSFLTWSMQKLTGGAGYELFDFERCLKLEPHAFPPDIARHAGAYTIAGAGKCVGPIRTPEVFRLLRFGPKIKTVCVWRNPLDVVESMYFAERNYHPPFFADRVDAKSMGFAEFAAVRLSQHLARMMELRRALAGVATIDFFYQDIIGRSNLFVLALAELLGLQVPMSVLQEVNIADYFRPIADETEHHRSGTFHLYDAEASTRFGPAAGLAQEQFEADVERYAGPGRQRLAEQARHLEGIYGSYQRFESHLLKVSLHGLMDENHFRMAEIAELRRQVELLSVNSLPARIVDLIKRYLVANDKLHPANNAGSHRPNGLSGITSAKTF